MDLSHPDVRAAAAQAMYEDARGEGWGDMPQVWRDRWMARWDGIATRIAPVIQQAAVREQMRGGGFDSPEESESA